MANSVEKETGPIQSSNLLQTRFLLLLPPINLSREWSQWSGQRDLLSKSAERFVVNFSEFSFFCLSSRRREEGSLVLTSSKLSCLFCLACENDRTQINATRLLRHPANHYYRCWNLKVIDIRGLFIGPQSPFFTLMKVKCHPFSRNRISMVFFDRRVETKTRKARFHNLFFDR